LPKISKKSKSIDDIIVNYLEYCTYKNLSLKTIKSYHQTLMLFSKYLEEEKQITDINKINRNTVEEYISLDARLDKFDTSLSERVKKSTANITYFVNATSGNDNNDGLTVGTAFKTIQKAIDLFPQIINHDMVINLAQGTYPEWPILNGFSGQGSITITGGADLTSALNYIVKGFYFKNCNLPIICNYISSNSNDSNSNDFFVHTCKSVRLIGCLDTMLANKCGVYAYASFLRIDSCIISNKTNAVISDFSRVLVVNCSGTGNSSALVAVNAGTLGVSGTSQPSGTTKYYSASGGQINGVYDLINATQQQIYSNSMLSNGWVNNIDEDWARISVSKYGKAISIRIYATTGANVNLPAFNLPSFCGSAWVTDANNSGLNITDHAVYITKANLGNVVLTYIE
jgi:integrase/recombinase XerD